MKNFEKRLGALAFILLLSSPFLQSCQRNEAEPTSISAKTGIADWTIFKFHSYIGRESQQCLSGWGLCRPELIILGWHVLRTANPGEPMDFTGYLEDIDGPSGATKKLVFEFVYPGDVTSLGGDRVVQINQALNVNHDTAVGMGYQSIIIQPGSYAYDSSIGNVGGFKLTVVTAM